MRTTVHKRDHWSSCIKLQFVTVSEKKMRFCHTGYDNVFGTKFRKMMTEHYFGKRTIKLQKSQKCFGMKKREKYIYF